MFDLLLKDATVIDIDDTDKKGKVKVKIMPDLMDVEDDLLPWAIPFNSLNSTTIFSNDLPEVDSVIRVLVTSNWQRVYYLQNRFFENLFNFDTVDTQLSTITEINNKEYKNLVFRMYLDGGLDFHNNDSGEHGIINKNGSYIFFDKDGKIIINSNDEITVNTSEKVIINGSTIEFNGDSNNLTLYTELKAAIDGLITQLNSHTHMVVSIGSPTGPASGSVPPVTFSCDVSTAKANTLKTGG
jgi:hypothetical protein